MEAEHAARLPAVTHGCFGASRGQAYNNVVIVGYACETCRTLGAKALRAWGWRAGPVLPVPGWAGRLGAPGAGSGIENAARLRGREPG